MVYFTFLLARFAPKERARLARFAGNSESGDSELEEPLLLDMTPSKRLVVDTVIGSVNVVNESSLEWRFRNLWEFQTLLEYSWFLPKIKVMKKGLEPRLILKPPFKGRSFKLWIDQRGPEHIHFSLPDRVI